MSVGLPGRKGVDDCAPVGGAGVEALRGESGVVRGIGVTLAFQRYGAVVVIHGTVFSGRRAGESCMPGWSVSTVRVRPEEGS